VGVRAVESLAQQLAAFFAVTAAGGAGGLLFDLYRFLRREVPRWGGLVDGLFWLVAGPTMLLLITLANWASLRFYLVVALGLGFFLYAQLLSPLVTWVLLEGSRLFGLGVRGLTSVGLAAARWPATRLARRATVRPARGWRRAPLLWQTGWVGRGRR